MKLSECLKENSLTLGQNCINLGNKTNASLLNGRKILLSFTGKSDWKILKLNLFELFLRKFLGAYKSTHLDYIAKKLNKQELTDDIKDCHTRIQTIWSKKNLIGLGNANFSEAKIVCFAEDHLDKSFQTSVAQLINAHYKEGDVVLIEGVEADKIIEANDYPQTRNLKPSCIVKGWEDENFKTITDETFKESRAMHKALMACYDVFSENLPSEGTLTVEQISLVKIKLHEFLEKINKLNEYYKSKYISQGKVFLENLFENLKTGSLSLTAFKGGLACIMSELEKNQYKAFYKNATHNQVKEAKKTANVRNESLIREISKYQNNKQRIFVIAGKAHLLPMGYRHVSVKEVQATLQKDKFIIITRNSLFTRVLARINSNLMIRAIP